MPSNTSWRSAGLDQERTIAGLTNGLEYAFEVRAVNRVGPGPAGSVVATPVGVPGVLVLNVDAIATGNIINIAEKGAGFSISGDTGTESGVSVTVTVGTTDLTATSPSADSATWSVSVPADASYITGTSVDVTVSAAKTGYTSPSDVQRTLMVDLTAPTAPSYAAPATLTVGTAITPISPSGGAGIDGYSATGLPPGLSLDTGTGAISGTPDTADANTASATVTVSDTAGNSAAVSITFPLVARAKNDQTLSGFKYSASSVRLGSSAPTVTAPSGAQTTVSYSATPATVCTVNSSTGALTLVGVGSCEITVTAAPTAGYNTATATYIVTVQSMSTEVTLTVNPATLDEHAAATVVTVTGTLKRSPRATDTVVIVSVGEATDAATEGTDYTAVDDLTLTIDAGQTSGTVTFTLTPTDDGVVEGDETLTVSGTTSDEGLAVTGTGVTIGDDDERGVLVNPISLTVSEGDSATYTVVLGSRPSGTVRVTISGTTGTDLRRSRSFLSFRTSNWNEPQTVTVTARQDEDAEDDTVTISHAVSGADYEANGVTVDAVSVTIDDDDRVSTGVDLSVSHTSFDEDASFTGVVVTGTLNGIARAEPTTLTLSVGASEDAATEGTDYVAVDDLGLTIPAGQASATAIFVFKPTDDLIDEPAEAVSITGATGVAGFEVTGTTLLIKDNDERGVTVSPAELVVAEGASATYTVVLDTEPTDTVTVTPSVSASPDVTFEPSSLTFTLSDWATAQTMTLSATEDDDAYHDSSLVSHAAEGADYDAFAGGAVSVTISDNEVASEDMLPAQVTNLTATGTATHVDLGWDALEEAVLGYRVEASYDGGANWAEVADNTETAYRHEVGLNFTESRLYRVSAVGGNGAGLPSAPLWAGATSTAFGLTATVRSPEDLLDSMSEDTTDPMSGMTAEPAPAIDLCWIPDGADASELSDIAMAWTPVNASGSSDPRDLAWQSIGSGSSEIDCADGIGARVTSIGDNRRYAFRMRANHAGAWLVSNDAQAVLVDASKPLRTIVTAGASGLSGDTPVPELLCRDYDDPATREAEEGSFFLSIGFTTASAQYLRYEPVNGFDPSSDLTLVNATAQRVDQPYDAQLGYRVRITPSVWGEPVAVSVPGDVVTHAETSVGNLASGEFRLETSDAVDCDISTSEPARRSQVTAVGIEEDGDRNGEWTAFEPIRVTLQFDEPVRVDTTDGVPSVTLTLGNAATTEQSPEGGAAAEVTAVQVTAPFSHVVHEDTLVFEHLVTEDESPIGDITLLADSLALNGGRIDSFSGPAVDLAHPEAAVLGGQIVKPDLTAGWSMIPGAHEGSESPFEIRLRFSEDVDLIEVIGEQNLLEHAFTVTGGAIESIAPSRDRQGEYLADEWTLSVQPDSGEPVTILPVAGRECDQPGAICTIDDRLLFEAPSVTVHRTDQALSVADAEVGEGPGAVLVFEVTLTRAAEQTVKVDYETADGTATAGEDYEAVSGTLSFEAGQTAGRVEVSVLDDSHDEGEESLTLILSNASNARIANGEAIGIIVNSDPIPTAWLTRFGRAASDHVAQAVARRFERRSSEEHLRVGGVRLDRLFASFSDPDAGRAESGSAQMDLDPRASGAMQPPPGLWSATGSGNNSAPPAGSGLGTGSVSSGQPGGFGAQGLAGDMTAPYARTSRGSGTLPSLRDVLMGSSFFHTFGAAEDPSSSPLTAWGETATTRFSGSEGALSLDGEVTTALLGLDKRYGRWLVGSTLSYSKGDGGYQGSGALGGSVHSTLAGLNPYAHFELSETTSLWGVFGYGEGRLRLTPQGAESAIETGLSNRMAAFGGRGLLSVRTGDAGRFELALRSDALVTRTDSDAVQGLVAARGATSRVRLMLEGSGSMPLATGGVLKPSLEAGLHYDAGDAETGAGLEVGGGLGYAAGRLSVDINARTLVAHEDSEYEEWGFSGSLAYTPGKDGQGLSMKLGSAWGATQSGVQSLWSQQDASGLARNTPFEAAQRFQAELGYGIAGRRKAALWVPFIAAQAADGDSQSLRMGVKLTSGPNVEAGLEVGRLENGRGAPEHAMQLRGALRW